MRQRLPELCGTDRADRSVGQDGRAPSARSSDAGPDSRRHRSGRPGRGRRRAVLAMTISLGDRLRQVVSGTRPALRELRIERDEPAPPRRPALDGCRVADVLAGQWIEGSEGAVVVVDRYYAAD